MFVIGEKVETVESNEFDTDYIVKFEYNLSFTMEEICDNKKEETSSKEPERLLNLINRYRLLKAKFVPLNKKGLSWFDTRTELDNIKSLKHDSFKYNESDIERPKCRLITGFNISFRKTSKGVGIICDNKLKPMVNSTIYQLLQFEKNKNKGNEYLKEWFKKYLFNKLAICSYNKRFVEMKSIDFNENENTKFERTDNKTSHQISYKDYLEKQYQINVNFKEFCVIKDKYGSAFLPQFLSISATNDMLGNDGIDQIRNELDQMSPTERMEAIAVFCETANKRSINISEGFTTMSQPTLTNADILPNVFFEIITRNGPNIKNQVEFPDFNNKNIHDFNYEYGNKCKPDPINLAVITDINHSHLSQNIQNMLDQFCRKRNFPNNPFKQRIVNISIDLQRSNKDQLLEISMKLERNRNINCVLMILPDGVQGSTCKVMLY